MSGFIEALRKVPPALGMQVIAAHLLLVVGVLFGGLPYVIVQCLLGAELLLINLATIPLYPQRSLRRHVGDILKSTGLLAFVLFFLLVAYGVVAAAAGRSGYPLERVAGVLRHVGAGDLGWALAYLFVRVGFTAWQARESRDPRGTWTRQSLAFGGSTLVAMLLMVFVSFFAGMPLAKGLASAGVHVDVDALLTGLMACVRCFTALVATTIPDGELDSIARDPYVARESASFSVSRVRPGGYRRRD